ncbi:MAG: alpha/beta hydrolase [Desulfobacterales bacterium]
MLKILTWGLVFYLLYCGLMFLFQRQIIFPRHHAEQLPESAKKISGLEKIWLELSFGKVESWFLPPIAEGKHPVMIFAHGNAELIDHWVEAFLPLTRSGLGVYLVEYPGYGRSQGLPSQDTVVETFTEAYDYIIGRSDVDPEKVVFLGRSLGGGVVCALAQKRKPAAIILMSTFTGISAMAKKFGVPGFFIRDPFDNLKTVESYDRPLLVIHGKHDGTVPYSHGVKLSKNAPYGKLITYDCGHNDCPPDWDTFYDDIRKFLINSKIQNEKKS